MNIKVGKLYENRTKKYLLPCLIGHGEKFREEYSKIFKLAIGIHDCLLDGSEESKSKNIYILCDNKAYPTNFQNFLYWIRSEKYYVTDYCPDSEIKTSRHHTIVLRIPKQYENAYDMFRAGFYSKMYTEDQLDKLFSTEDKQEAKKVLLKSVDMIEIHCNRVNEEFDGNAKPEDFIEAELDFPISVHPETEIFNYWLNNKL